jgi:signal peptidase I
VKTPAFLDPDAPFDRPRPEAGPDGLTDSQRRVNMLARRLLFPLLTVFVALVLVFFVFYDYAQVDGWSMFPTLSSGEYVLITKGVADPKRGDIVDINVIDRGKPAEWIKLIVALPGDHVVIRGNVATVNGKPEAFPHPITDDGTTKPQLDLIVPRGHVYCLGDNRVVSFDSRYVGPFEIAQLHGKVVAVYAPITRLRLVAGP